MRILTAGLLLLLGAGTAAGALPFEEAVDDFRQALEDRVAAVGELPSPTKEESREARGLARALGRVAAWGGGTDPRSLGPLAAALGRAFKASTHTLVFVRALALGNEMRDLAGDARRRAEAARDAIGAEAGRAKVQLLIERTEAALAGMREQDWGRRARAHIRAIAGFERAATAAERIRARIGTVLGGAGRRVYDSGGI